MDLLFLEKCFGSCLKPLFNPTASMTDSHESKLGNGKQFEQKYVSQRKIFVKARDYVLTVFL